MKYSYLGKTGMKVPVLSFGASSLGGVFRSVSEAEAIRAVFTAIEHGMTFIDVSPYYGHTKAETVLGGALTELPRESFLLSTKVGRYGANGVNLWDYSAQRTRESVFESMERLHVDYIDLINVHDIEFADRPAARKPEMGHRPCAGGDSGKRAQFLPLFVKRRPVSRFLGLLRGKRNRSHQRISILHGVVVATWCTGMASGSGCIGRSLPQSLGLLSVTGLSYRKVSDSVFGQQSSYWYHPFQFCQSGQRAQEYTIYRGADRLGFGSQSERNHRRPTTCNVEKHIKTERDGIYNH